jgi:methylmalonyl-CoA/ethylmalonyl-CoA epimerase
MIKKIEHIGVAVKDITQAMQLFGDVLGLPLTKSYESESTKVKLAFFSVGDSTIELLQPTDPTSVMGKFLERKGEGIHHICLGVEKIGEALDYFASQGVELIDKKPRKSQDHRLIAFLNPKSTHGVLIELEEIDQDHGKQEKK